MNRQRSGILALLVTMVTVSTAGATPRGNGKIAYDSTRAGNIDVFVMEADGTAPLRLTNNTAQDRAPAFSPDGSRIAFHSTRNGNADIYLINADGTGLVRLTSDPANELQPAWSPDGTRLAYAKMNPTSGTHDVWVIGADGSGAANLTSHAANDIRPSFAPDGGAVVFQSDRDGNSEIYLVPVGPAGATGPAVNLTHHTAEDTDPVFTADGTQIVFVSDRTALRTRLYRMYRDGTLPAQLPGTADFDKDPAISPDGTAVVFAAQRGTSTDEIWSVSLGDGTARRLTTDSFADRSPDWQGLVLVSNHPPLADAGPDGSAPCADADGASVALNGSASSDPDSTPGTNDDVAVFEWFAAFGTADERLLATGMQPTVTLPPGTTEVTLRVTDGDGLQDTDSATWTVTDPQAPSLMVTVEPGQLWPPNHQMVDVHATVKVSGGVCSPAPEFALQSVESSEPDRNHPRRAAIAGAEIGTPDVDLQLRAERRDKAGRVYTITYAITTGAAAGTTTFAQVIVPHDQRLEAGTPPLRASDGSRNKGATFGSR